MSLRLSTRFSFWAITWMPFALFGAAAAPAPLYGGNRPMRRLLEHVGPTRVLSSEAGAVEYAVDLTPGGWLTRP